MLEIVSNVFLSHSSIGIKTPDMSFCSNVDIKGLTNCYLSAFIPFSYFDHKYEAIVFSKLH